MDEQSRTHGKTSRSFVIKDRTNGNVICTEGKLADTAMTRLFGLLGRRGLDRGAGLWIKPSSGVHTFGMAFAIDIVSLDKEQRVIGLFESIGPWTVRGLSLKTRSVLELPAGRIRECGIAPGDQLALEAS